VDTELSDGRIIGDHFRRVVRRDTNLIFGCQQIKITGDQDYLSSCWKPFTGKDRPSKGKGRISTERQGFSI
jgi:hypothetical protein